MLDAELGFCLTEQVRFINARNVENAQMAKTVDTAEKVLKFLTDNKGTSYSRADIEAKIKVPASVALTELRNENKVKTEGERRGMKYAAK